jgi:hypothetical protein
MKKLIILFVTLIQLVVITPVIAQNATVVFNYDDNGNRTSTMLMVTRVTENGTNTIDTDSSTEVNLSVYPNPVDNYLLLSMGSCEVDGFEAILMSVEGNVLYKTAISSDHAEFDMTQYTSGVYFLYVENGDDRYVWKIIKRQ